MSALQRWCKGVHIFSGGECFFFSGCVVSHLGDAPGRYSRIGREWERLVFDRSSECSSPPFWFLGQWGWKGTVCLLNIMKVYVLPKIVVSWLWALESSVNPFGNLVWIFLVLFFLGNYSTKKEIRSVTPYVLLSLFSGAKWANRTYKIYLEETKKWRTSRSVFGYQKRRRNSRMCCSCNGHLAIVNVASHPSGSSSGLHVASQQSWLTNRVVIELLKRAKRNRNRGGSPESDADGPFQENEDA